MISVCDAMGLTAHPGCGDNPFGLYCVITLRPTWGLFTQSPASQLTLAVHDIVLSRIDVPPRVEGSGNWVDVSLTFVQEET